MRTVPLRFLFLFLCAASLGATAAVDLRRQTEHDNQDASITSNGTVIHLPLERRVRKKGIGGASIKRAADGDALGDEGDIGAIGLGDALDITYNVLVQVGSISTPLVLDTGSADLWVISDTCSACPHVKPINKDMVFYPSRGLTAVADAQLFYGDSRTGTHAFGIIGADTVGVAGFTIENQYFAAINDTNTTVLDTGSTGIFGLGFPMNSILWNEMYTTASLDPHFPQKGKPKFRGHDLYSRLRTFPSPSLFRRSTKNLAVVRNSTATESGMNILSSLMAYGPLVSRLVLNADSNPSKPSPRSPHLASPEYSVTLQRTSPSVSGNVGALTLGGLPSGVDSSALVWAPVRRYTEAQNGVVVPEAPKEIYPYAWDVPLDGVFFDGVRLADSVLGDITEKGVGTSALIDTGSSLIRGPADVVAAVLALLANATDPESFLPAALSAASSAEEFTAEFNPFAYVYPCAEPHTLSFQFAGARFNVDPRDFGRPAYTGNTHWCVPNIVPTDPPTLGGYLYSWSLGEPFLKGVLASFYYGNLTHPSADPPRVGFLSTVSKDATLQLAADVRAAQSAGRYPGEIFLLFPFHHVPM
ncbi:acid protease [Phellopilus nigrolimitatus]|nr:acid protease [Phellopilus nigrolimitatus]